MKEEWIEERISILIHDAHMSEAKAKVRAAEMYAESMARKEKLNYELGLTTDS